VAASQSTPLMKHWRTLLGDRLHEIVYEDLVREPKRIGAIVARHCGLAWTDAAVDISEESISVLDCERSAGASTYLRKLLRPLAPLPPASGSADWNAAPSWHIASGIGLVCPTRLGRVPVVEFQYQSLGRQPIIQFVTRLKTSFFSAKVGDLRD
jgi:hypothetical protein